MAFETKLYIRFHHVDFARVVYFPRFFDYCHQVFEDFVQAEFGRSYHSLMEKEGLGFPLVHAEADFKTPFRFGEIARVVLEIKHMGETSLSCLYTFFHEGTPPQEETLSQEGTPPHEGENVLKEAKEAAARITLVGSCIHLKQFKPTPIPEGWRSIFAKHCL
ncbi:MAG: acyl-CoA thioesterase [Cystobacterineae bacterium]|nr:acyl-CoA thioesterase [Cystobacterineae bacterium]